GPPVQGLLRLFRRAVGAPGPPLAPRPRFASPDLLTSAAASAILPHQAPTLTFQAETDTPIMRYQAPDSLDAAVALLAGAQGEARVLAGGTDLLVQMRADIVDPELIVDIKQIRETRVVAEERGGWRIGAAVTGAELRENSRLKREWPGVVEAANLIGSTQIQGRAT